MLRLLCRLCQLTDEQFSSGWKRHKWLTSLLGVQSRVEKLHNVFAQCVTRALSERREAEGKHVTCLLDALAASETLSHEEIVSTVVSFIVLGYDRVSSASHLALKELSKQTKTQQAIGKEIKQHTLEHPESLKSFDQFLLDSSVLRPETFCFLKWITIGVPLNGFFIPPNASVLFCLREKYPGVQSADNLPHTIVKALVGNVVKSFDLNGYKVGDDFMCKLTRKAV